jgi:archaellum component FlaC
MEDKINNLEKKIDEIYKKLDNIEKILQNDIKNECNKMGEHIDFIEKIYDNVKAPLNYIIDKTKYLGIK